ncbi:hypothetical protein M9Y10_000565 [Tritrichomonas musculus]|uniref:Peptidase M1 membrane alanine aminopeptidase domain-containing protein n=1 Tax=Tritrichomonas musculus TaxID=1915356 RepID=A0ABR2L4K3_9EUKA
MSERLPQNYIPSNYDLYIHIIKEEKQFNASLTITFQKTHDDDKLLLNIGQSITINAIFQKNIELRYDIDYPILTIYRPTEPEIDFDTHPLTISYSIKPLFHPKQKIGLYIYEGCYLTHLEPLGARELMPCFDEPCVRSTFSIKVRIPTYLTAISNMPVESIDEKDNEYEKEVKFLTTPPMCTYLLCICVGTFSAIERTTEKGVPIQYYSKSDNEKNFERYLDAATFAMNWMESKFHIDYELPHLQLLSLDGCTAGMENYGLITLPDYTRYTNIVQNISVVIHEVIHQWFGNLVSIQYWNYLWLKEGFAQFIQYLILNDYMPNSNAFQIFAFNDGMKSLDYFDSGVIMPSESEVDFDHLFDSLTYSKGAFVLKMFHNLIGQENFLNICHKYLNDFKNKSVILSDFISVVNSSLNEDYSSFFNCWLKKKGFPVLTVRENGPNLGITIVQMKQGDEFYKFKVPVVYSKDGEIKSQDVVISNYITQVSMNFDWILVNNNFSSLCFVVYSKNLLNCLLKAKKEGKISFLNQKLIVKSIKSECTPFLIDDEMLEMSSEFE